jgi:glycosyltransferase involved in cell wall biosynthesis
VSIVHMYKHQWHVAKAVADLRADGIPVVLDLVGPAYAPALRRLQSTLARLDPTGEFIHYSGLVPRALLHERYLQNQLCVFASSCENMPNILLEGMASGLPIACSNRGPMPEVLGEAGVYFDPEDPADIAAVLRKLIASPALRTKLARASFEGVGVYSWRRCADDTFGFLTEIAAGCARREVTA